MDKQTLQKKIRDMAAAPSCCSKLKAEVQFYFAAVGTANEKLAAQNLIAEIQQDITPIDKLVEFAHSARAIQILGKDAAKKLSAHADALKDVLRKVQKDKEKRARQVAQRRATSQEGALLQHFRFGFRRDVRRRRRVPCERYV